LRSAGGGYRLLHDAARSDNQVATGIVHIVVADADACPVYTNSS
jgi:hypothetical protein